MIITIAVYDAKRIEQKAFVFFGATKTYIALECRKLDDTPISDYEMTSLVAFEKAFLQQRADGFLESKESYDHMPGQHFYTFKTDDGLSLVVLITKSMLNQLELLCIKYHLLSAMYNNPELDEQDNNLRIKKIFKRIVKTPFYYTSRQSLKEKSDQQIKKIQDGLEETRKQLKKDIELLLNRGDGIENLGKKTEELELVSKGFKSVAFEANRSCCKTAFG